MQSQATMLSYQNAFVVLSSLLFVLVPLPFLMRLPKRREKPSLEAASGH
jgi:DHA2 family multidrug resistance protein